MIILLHGPDTFRSQQKRKELIAAYRGKYVSGLSESSFGEEDFSLRDFEEHVRGQALFSAKRLVLMSNISQNKTALYDLEASIKKNDLINSRDVFVVAWEDRDVQKVKEVAFLLKAASMVQPFPLLEGSVYRTWLLKTKAGMGAEFAPAALDLFASWHEGDSWQSVNDMQKLHAYAGGKIIQIDDVKKLCIKPTALSIFTTLDLLFGRRGDEAFAALEKHIQSGEEPLYLLKMFSYQLRLVALAKEKIDAAAKSGQAGAAVSLPGVHPYAVRKVTPLARDISWEKLNKLFGILYRSDAAIKQGTADPQLCLELFAYNVALLR